MGEKAGINWKKVPAGDLGKGLKEEKEHDKKDSLNITHGDKKVTEKIALEHIKEKPNYYTKLKKAMGGGKHKLDIPWETQEHYKKTHGIDDDKEFKERQNKKNKPKYPLKGMGKNQFE